MQRGEVWWADLPPPAGPRPVVVLTRNSVLDYIDSIVVRLVTRRSRGLQSEVSLGRIEGLPAPSVANSDNLLTVPKVRLKRLLGALRQEKLEELGRAVRFALDLG